jgi:diguanylate cyclase (GGDEF)-like protein
MIGVYLKRFGLWPVLAAVTLASIVASIIITGAIHYFVLDIPMERSAWTIAIACPALIAPMMSGISFHLVLQLERAHERLRELTNSDPLTGSYNRRYFMEKLRAELERADRYGTPFSVAFVDIDDFKKINDRYGHLGGDEVLKGVAEACLAHVRQIDVFARIGGEEFAVLLPQTAGDDARQLMERLRACVAKLRVDVADAAVCVTVSIGLASHTGQIREINALMRLADEALYQAKRQGKNQVVSQAASDLVGSAAPC